jgi:hypothetical protein
LGKEAKKVGPALDKSLKGSKKASSALTKDVDKLNKNLKETSKSAGALKGAFGALGSVIGAGLLAKGFADATRLAIEAAESQNLFSVSLGKNVDAAQVWSRELSSSLGLYETSVRKNLGVLTVMLDQMGLSEDAAFDMGKSLTALAYDLSSFYNLNHDQAFEKIRSGIVGESEPLKQLGIVLNETTVKEKAYAEGLVDRGKKLSEVQKIQARYLVLMDQTKKAQGDYLRTADSTSNLEKSLGAQFQTTATILGSKVDPAYASLLKYLKELLKDGGEWVDGRGPELEASFLTIAQSIQSLVSTVLSLSSTLNNLSFGGLEASLKGLLGLLNLVTYTTAKMSKSAQLVTLKLKGSGKRPSYNELYASQLKSLALILKI